MLLVISPYVRARSSQEGLAASRAARQGGPRLSQSTKQQRERTKKKAAEQEEAVQAASFVPPVATTWRRLVRDLGGVPSVFAASSATDRSERFGGRPFADFTVDCQGKLSIFVKMQLGSPRNIILVNDVARLPADVHVAAVLLGAHVREKLLTPALHFKAHPCS